MELQSASQFINGYLSNHLASAHSQESSSSSTKFVLFRTVIHPPHESAPQQTLHELFDYNRGQEVMAMSAESFSAGFSNLHTSNTSSTVSDVASTSTSHKRRREVESEESFYSQAPEAKQQSGNLSTFRLFGKTIVVDKNKSQESGEASNTKNKSYTRTRPIYVVPLRQQSPMHAAAAMQDQDRDQFPIKKTLTGSDVNHLARLLLPKNLVETHIIPFLTDEQKLDVDDSEKGIRVDVTDLETDTLHKLTFKKVKSTECYILKANWRKEFVRRRALQKGDKIGMSWNCKDCGFGFIVLEYAQ